MTAIRQTAVVGPEGTVNVKSSELKPGETVEVIVLAEAQVPKKADGDPYAWMKIAQELKLQGPADLSERLDDYLYRNAGDARQ